MEENKTIVNKNEVNETDAITPAIGIFERFMNVLKKYGIFKTIMGAITFVIFSYLAYIAVNPQEMFERYDKYIEEKHVYSNEYRMKSIPLIRSYLNQLAFETSADRAFIIEYHNGKSNASGLQWLYGDMTFVNDSIDDVSDEYQNVSLTKYPIFYELYKDGLWIGDMDELREIDPKFTLKLQVNDVERVGLYMIYGSDLCQIGILGVSYTHSDVDFDASEIKRYLHKFATSISPLLDGKKAY